jgi:hypothetical protein
MSYGYSINLDVDRAVSHGEQRVTPPKWGKQAIKDYIANLARLQGPAPYAGPEFGYSPATLSMMAGGPLDMAAGAKRGAGQAITDYYARPGAPGTGSYAEGAALAGLENEYAARGAEGMRSTLIADETQRRADAALRLREGVMAGNLARSFATTRQRNRTNSVSRDSTASFGSGGGGGGGGMSGTEV